MKKRMLFILVISIFLYTGCSSEEQSTEAPTPQPTQQETEENADQPNENEQDVEEAITDSEQGEMRDPFENLLERAPEEPTTVEEALSYPVGPLTNNLNQRDRDYQALKVMEILPPIEEGASQEELDAWWRAYRYLLAHEYPNPDQYFTEFNIASFGGADVEDERYHFKEQISDIILKNKSTCL
ncbi:hypothetical protein [Alkalihalobacterium bogoriense]|uniref:hypothetical protein n=1 Tax=Alkalihalobacterium bogoriense TaxID=246272 RepID=UPI0006864E70|nr:hypothetical protein [Alkalihalobacterium bogoriense]